jgi:hypothetical protein
MPGFDGGPGAWLAPTVVNEAMPEHPKREIPYMSRLSETLRLSVENVDPSAKSRLIHFCCVAVASASLIALGVVMFQARNVLLERGRLAKLTATLCDSSPTCEPNANQSSRSSASAPDFVAELGVDVSSDTEFRFASRLAAEQRVELFQMQSESLQSAPRQLRQTRLTMQLRGDYGDIKTLLAGMLEKFKGLTLQRLTIRHRDGGIDQGHDDAVVELIQYTRPAVTG